MRSRRRLAPQLEQLESRVVLSRLSLVPMDAPDSPPHESLTEDTTPAQDLAPEPIAMPRTISPTPPSSSPPARTDSPQIVESEPAPTVTPSEPRDYDSVTTASSPPPSSSPPKASEPVTPTEPRTRTDSPQIVESEPAPTVTPSEPRFNDPRATDAEPAIDDSTSGSDASRIDNPRETTPTETTPANQDTPLELQPRKISRTPSSGDTSGGVSASTETKPTIAVNPASMNTPLPATPPRSDGTNPRTVAEANAGEAVPTESSQREGDPDSQEPSAEPAPPWETGAAILAEPSQPAERAKAVDVVFSMSPPGKTTKSPASPPNAAPQTPSGVEVITYSTAAELPAAVGGDHVSEEFVASGSFPVLTPEALAAGVLAWNATHAIRRLTGAWGSDEFFLNDADAHFARRSLATMKRRRNRKREPKEPRRVSKARDGVFAENCLMSLLDLESRPQDETQESSLAGIAWFWAKLTALAGTATAFAKLISKRMSVRTAIRLKPPAPRYNGPTLWQ